MRMPRAGKIHAGMGREVRAVMIMGWSRESRSRKVHETVLRSSLRMWAFDSSTSAGKWMVY